MMKTVLEAKNNAVVSSQYIQYTKILQMPVYELRQMIREELYDNPFLELSEGELELQEPFYESDYQEQDSRGNQEEYEEYNDKFSNTEWDAYYGSVGVYGRDETLADYLISQLKIEDSKRRQTVQYLIYLLDEDGYLRESVEEIAENLHTSVKQVEEALAEVKRLEPAGVGAADLMECLKLQIARQDIGMKEICEQIISGFLPELGKKKYAAIAKCLKVHKKDVEQAAELIRGLNPAPGQEFASVPKTRYVMPELLLKADGEDMTVEMIRGVLPELRLNKEYIQMLKDVKDDKSKEYMKEYLSRAKKLSGFVDGRNSTLLKIAGNIVSWQHEFFLHGDKRIVPMTLTDIASMAEMHEATISRVVNEKYIMTENGTYALNDFFTRSVSELQDGEQLSAIQIQDKIKEIQKQYCGQKRLSDQKIADILSEQGICIARRTVAKYRKLCR